MEEKSPLSAIVSLIFPGLPNNNSKQDENITLRGFANDSDIQNVIPWKILSSFYQYNIVDGGLNLWTARVLFRKFEIY